MSFETCEKLSHVTRPLVIEHFSLIFNFAYSYIISYAHVLLAQNIGFSYNMLLYCSCYIFKFRYQTKNFFHFFQHTYGINLVQLRKTDY